MYSGGEVLCQDTSDKSAKICFFPLTEESKIPANVEECGFAQNPETGEFSKACVVPKDSVTESPPAAPAANPVSSIWQLAADGANKLLEKHNIPIRLDTVPDAGPDAGEDISADAPQPPPPSDSPDKEGEVAVTTLEPGSFDQAKQKIYPGKIVANVYQGLDGEPWVDDQHINDQLASHGMTNAESRAKLTGRLVHDAEKIAAPGQSVEWNFVVTEEGQKGLQKPVVKGEAVNQDSCEIPKDVSSHLDETPQPASTSAAKPKPKPKHKGPKKKHKPKEKGVTVHSSGLKTKDAGDIYG